MKWGHATSVIPIGCFHVSLMNFKPLTGSNSGKNLSLSGTEAARVVTRAKSWIHSSLKIYLLLRKIQWSATWVYQENPSCLWAFGDCGYWIAFLLVSSTPLLILTYLIVRLKFSLWLQEAKGTIGHVGFLQLLALKPLLSLWCYQQMFFATAAKQFFGLVFAMQALWIYLPYHQAHVLDFYWTCQNLCYCFHKTRKVPAILDLLLPLFKAPLPWCLALPCQRIQSCFMLVIVSSLVSSFLLDDLDCVIVILEHDPWNLMSLQYLIFQGFNCRQAGCFFALWSKYS